MATYTEIATAEARKAALAVCRGDYQRSLIDGYEAWSGATLRGKAREYGGKYKVSRDNLVQRLKAAGIAARFETREHNRIVLVIEG